MKNGINRMLNAAAELLFPRRCPVCDDIVWPRGELICPGCLRQLKPVREPVCKKCGKELSDCRAEYCGGCVRYRRSFEEGRALLNYNEAARKSVTAIKYKNRREYLDFYAAAMARRYEPLVRRWNPDALMPVPVHPSRLRTRGYNQAEELARRLSVFWRLPLETKRLIRVKKTIPQKQLGSAERLKNLQQAFRTLPSVSGEELMPSILLIDDIYTTGSTVEACTRALLAAGAQRVYFLTICIGGGR